MRESSEKCVEFDQWTEHRMHERWYSYVGMNMNLHWSNHRLPCFRNIAPCSNLGIITCSASLVRRKRVLWLDWSYERLSPSWRRQHVSNEILHAGGYLNKAHNIPRCRLVKKVGLIPPAEPLASSPPGGSQLAGLQLASTPRHISPPFASDLPWSAGAGTFSPHWSP